MQMASIERCKDDDDGTLSSPEFGVWFQPTTAPATVARWATIAEDEGFSFVGMTDGQNIWRDVYICLTAAALKTRHIRLGPWVTNPFTRHPTVTANSIATLDELSDGRVFLGIGIGDDSVRTIGHRMARLDELAEIVKQIRRLLKGETVETPDGQWSLATRRGGKEIYWACANPRSLEYAGRFADGAIISAWLVPAMMTAARQAVDGGASAAGREPRTVAKIFNTCVSVMENGQAAREAARPYVARALCYAASAQVPGWSQEEMKRFRSQYNYYDHFSPDQAVAKEVPEHMITKKAVAGTPEECTELLQLVIDHAFDKIALIPMGDVESTVRLLAKRVLPRLRFSAHDAPKGEQDGEEGRL